MNNESLNEHNWIASFFFFFFFSPWRCAVYVKAGVTLPRGERGEEKCMSVEIKNKGGELEWEKVSVMWMI